MRIPITVQTLIRREGAQWVAQVLEYDIASQAPTLAELHYEMRRILTAHIMIHEREGRDPWASTPPAPQPYWDEWHRATIAVYWRNVLDFVADPPLKRPTPQLEARFAPDV